MAIDGINSLSEAIKVYNNPNTSNDDKRAILAKYPDITKYISTDKTKYEITDFKKEEARDKGTQKAKDATEGFDGKGDNFQSRAASANTVVNGIGGAVMGIIATLKTNLIMTKLGAKASGLIAAAVGAVILSNAIYLKTTKPNEEPANACETMTDVMQEEEGALNEAQSNMENAESEVAALSEEAESTNKDGNSIIDDKKTNFDIYRHQYDSLKAKAESGEQLLPEEKALMASLAPKMNEMGTVINDTEEETSDTVAGISEDIAEYQEVYDDSASTMETVTAETEYLAEFDEDTETNAKLVQTAAVIGMAGAAGTSVAGGVVISHAITKLAGAAAEIALGTVAIGEGIASGLLFNSVHSDQAEYENKASNAIDARGVTEDTNVATSEVYDSSLETHADLVDLVDNLELEVPADLEVPAGGVPTDNSGAGSSPFVAANNDNNGKTSGANGDDKDKKPEDDDKKGQGIA